MKKYINPLIICSALFLVSGCQQKKQNASIITMPLYEECVGDVTAYAKGMNETYEGTDLSLDIKLNYFNYKSTNHPTFIGYIELSGNESDQELNIYANGIRSFCYPEAGIRTKNGPYALGSITSEYKRNLSEGITTHYFNITEDEISMFYNDGKYDVDSLFGEPDTE